jgi:acetylornithine deacetylase/succinyl-diaminopimelate desuccinylase-like protein
MSGDNGREASSLLDGNQCKLLSLTLVAQWRKRPDPCYHLEDLMGVPAAETVARAEIVRALAAAIEAATGTRPRLEGSGPACDGWMFLTRFIPTVCGYGVTCGGVHGAGEWVDLESLSRVTEIYARTILSYLSPA